MQDLSCENEFTCMRIKNHFHINGFALSLALEQKLRTTRKRPTLLPDWLLKVIWWTYRLTTQMRLVLREHQRYSSFEFLLICLREQKLLGRSRNRSLEGNNKCKNTPKKSQWKVYLLKQSSVTTPPLPARCSNTLFIFSLNSDAMTFYSW